MTYRHRRSYLSTWTVPIAVVAYFGWPWAVLPSGAATIVGCIWIPVAVIILAKLRGKRPVRFRPAPPSVAQHVREPIPPEVRQFVWVRDGGRCRSCRVSDSDCMALYGAHLQFDHIIPWSLGGTNEAANIQLLCPPENRAKSNRLDWRPLT